MGRLSIPGENYRDIDLWLRWVSQKPLDHKRTWENSFLPTGPSGDMFHKSTRGLTAPPFAELSPSVKRMLFIGLQRPNSSQKRRHTNHAEARRRITSDRGSSSDRDTDASATRRATTGQAELDLRTNSQALRCSEPRSAAAYQNGVVPTV